MRRYGGGSKLRGPFARFPGGWPGVGLLLLRITVGLTAIVQGASYFTEADGLPLRPGILAACAISCGVSLILGLLTPLAGAVLALGAMGTALSWFPSPVPNPFDGTLPGFFAAGVAGCFVFLGPGALSVDARLFGRREIVIPRPPDASRTDLP